MRLRLLFFIAVAITAAGLLAIPVSAAASPQVSTDRWTRICDPGNDNCLKDESDAGLGNPVTEQAPDSSDAEQWKTVTDTARCGGTVSEASGCPFSNGSFDTMYNGKTIVVIKQEVTGLCVRTPAAMVGAAEMGDCDSTSVNEPSTAFVFDVMCGGSCNEYVSVEMTNADNSSQVIYSPPASDQQVFTDNPENLGNYVLWQCIDNSDC